MCDSGDATRILSAHFSLGKNGRNGLMECVYLSVKVKMTLMPYLEMNRFSITITYYYNVSVVNTYHNVSVITIYHC